MQFYWKYARVTSQARILAFSFGDHRDTERREVKCASDASVLVSDHRGARLCTGGEMQDLHRGKYLTYPAVLLFI